MKTEIQKNIGGFIKYIKRIDEIPIVPTSVKITIYDKEGNVIVDSADCTINSMGEIKYFLDTTNIDIGINYKAEFNIVTGTNNYIEYVLFDVVNVVLQNVVISDDIITEAPFLKNQNYKRIAMAQSGTLNTIIDNTIMDVDDYWTNSIIEIINGTNVGEKKRIISQKNFVLTVNSDFSNPIDNTSKYVITKSFKQEIETAFNYVRNDVNKFKGNSSGIIDSNVIKNLIIFKTLENICFNFTREDNDIWFIRYKEYQEKYNQELNSIQLLFDSNSDGNINDNDSMGFSQIRGVK